MNHQLVVGVCLLAVSACGAADVTIEDASPPVVLHEIDTTPGCYVPQNPYNGGDVGSTSMMTAMYELNLQMLAQRAQMLFTPILDDPTANEWLVDGVDARIEGQTLARGEGWGELIVILLNQQFSLRGEISYDPNATTVELSGGRLTQSANVVRTDDLTLGCDPEQRWSFRIAGGQTECWDQYGDPLAPPAPEDPTREELEMQMSTNMQCLWAAQRTMQF